MPAIAPLPPDRIKELLERSGFRVVDEDEFHWALSSGKSETLILIPKKCDRVPLETAFHVASQAGFSNYFEFLHSTTD